MKDIPEAVALQASARKCAPRATKMFMTHLTRNMVCEASVHHVASIGVKSKSADATV